MEPVTAISQGILGVPTTPDRVWLHNNWDSARLSRAVRVGWADGRKAVSDFPARKSPSGTTAFGHHIDATTRFGPSADFVMVKSSLSEAQEHRAFLRGGIPARRTKFSFVVTVCGTALRPCGLRHYREGGSAVCFR
jgi:hypothetical protein